MYFYAPIYTDPSSGSMMPGMYNESAEVIAPEKDYAPGSKFLHCDKEASIFVLISSSGLPGWVIKTEEQVNADYPGVLP